MCKKSKINEIIPHIGCGQIHEIQSFENNSTKEWRLVKNTEVAFQYYKANAWELKSEREKPCVMYAVELPLEEVGANFITRF